MGSDDSPDLLLTFLERVTYSEFIPSIAASATWYQFKRDSDCLTHNHWQKAEKV